MASDNRKRFLAIEAGRGIAALLVVLHHAGNVMREPRFYGADPFGGHLRNFNVGVDFFFVLSGFIITWVHWDDLGQRQRIGHYVRKRFLRVYPAYWGILFPLILFYLLLPRAGDAGQHDPVNMLLSVVLLPNPAQPLLGVAWTLTYEIFFYAIFALAIGFGRWLLIGLVAWAVAIMALWAAAPTPFPFSFLLSPFNLEFIMGVGAAALLRHHRVPAPGLAMALGLIGFAATMLFAPHIQDDALAGRLAFGGAALLFVLGAVEKERQAPFRIPAGLTLIGAASYSIYLIHPIVLVIAIHLVRRAIGFALPIDAIAILLAAIAASVGLAYHLLAEPQLTRLAKRLLDGKAAPAPRTTPEPVADYRS